MLSFETQTKLADLFLSIRRFEQQIDQIRQSLVQWSDFSGQKLFSYINQTGKGITSCDLVRVLDEQGVNLSIDDVYLIIRQYDRYDNARLNEENFYNLILPADTSLRGSQQGARDQSTMKQFTFLISKEIQALQHLDELKTELTGQEDFSLVEAFRFINREENSNITPTCLTQFLTSLNLWVDHFDIYAIFRRMDADKDGGISYSEFVEGMVPSRARKELMTKISSPRTSPMRSPGPRMAASPLESPLYSPTLRQNSPQLKTVESQPQLFQQRASSPLRCSNKRYTASIITWSPVQSPRTSPPRLNRLICSSKASPRQQERTNMSPLRSTRNSNMSLPKTKPLTTYKSIANLQPVHDQFNSNFSPPTTTTSSSQKQRKNSSPPRSTRNSNISPPKTTTLTTYKSLAKMSPVDDQFNPNFSPPKNTTWSSQKQRTKASPLRSRRYSNMTLPKTKTLSTYKSLANLSPVDDQLNPNFSPPKTTTASSQKSRTNQSPLRVQYNSNFSPPKTTTASSQKSRTNMSPLRAKFISEMSSPTTQQATTWDPKATAPLRSLNKMYATYDDQRTPKYTVPRVYSPQPPSSLSTAQSNPQHKRLNTRLNEGDKPPRIIRVFQHQIRLERKIERAQTSLAMQDDFAPDDMFRYFDAERKGYLSMTDFRRFFQHFGVEISTTELNLLAVSRGIDQVTRQVLRELLLPRDPSCFDIESNRLYSIESLSYPTSQKINSVLQFILQSELFSEQCRQHLRRQQNFDLLKQFASLDIAQEKWLKPKALLCILLDYNVKATMWDVKTLLGKYDVNKDGRVSYSDFAQEMTPKSPVKM